MKENRYKPSKRSTLFGWLDEWFALQGIFNLSTYHLYRFPCLFLLGLFYIWNVHHHEKMLHKVNQLQPIADGLRVKYVQLQSSYMFNSKQSEIAKRVAPLGIHESRVPPYIIINYKR